MPGDDLSKGFSVAARIGVELAATIIVGAFLGYLVDRWFSTLPWFVLVGLLLGTVAGFRNIYRVLIQAEKGINKEKNE